MDWGDIKVFHKKAKQEKKMYKPYEYPEIDISITEDEKESLSLACQRLFDLDTEGLTPNQDYKINVQEGKWSQDHSDKCDDNLFSFVNQDIFKHKPIYSKFFCLLDNYIAETGESEVVTKEEREENRNFLNELIKTPVIKYLYNYLVAINKFDGDLQQFKKLLNELWFELYTRKVKNDSSGFEHVFLGEYKNNAVTGFHNWIQFQLQERKGMVNYKGWLLNRKNKKHPPQSTDKVLNFNFDWGEEEKNCSTCFIGTSPAFEIAIYTLCFYAGEEENRIQIGKYDLIIKCYKYNYHGKQRIGSCFPMLI